MPLITTVALVLLAFVGGALTGLVFSRSTLTGRSLQLDDRERRLIQRCLEEAADRHQDEQQALSEAGFGLARELDLSAQLRAISERINPDKAHDGHPGTYGERP